MFNHVQSAQNISKHGFQKKVLVWTPTLKISTFAKKLYHNQGWADLFVPLEGPGIIIYIYILYTRIHMYLDAKHHHHYYHFRITWVLSIDWPNSQGPGAHQPIYKLSLTNSLEIHVDLVT